MRTVNILLFGLGLVLLLLNVFGLFKSMRHNNLYFQNQEKKITLPGRNYWFCSTSIMAAMFSGLASAGISCAGAAK